MYDVYSNRHSSNYNLYPIIHLYPITTVYKAGLSTLDDLYNLVTKIITKYPFLTTYKISKKYKFYISNFFEKIKFLFLEIL